jgi:hypothetical protein
MGKSPQVCACIDLRASPATFGLQISYAPNYRTEAIPDDWVQQTTELFTLEGKLVYLI